MSKKVLIALSGGVDSAVAAYLLKRQGYYVVAVTMCLGVKNSEERISCCGPRAIEDARRIADSLGIAHHVFDFAQELEEKVIASFISEYRRGFTPNPCIECNRYLKFDTLLKKALQLGFDYLATGHYAKIDEENGNFFIKRACDLKKDQSYFLYSIKRENLPYILFPLAELSKEQVRKIARHVGLPVAEKLQSQNLCFITNGDYRKFLVSRIGPPKEGAIMDKYGNILGKHKGIFYYTIGQREGLGISHQEPLYVTEIDVENNIIRVGTKQELKAKGLIAGKVNFFFDDLPPQVWVKLRSAHPGVECEIIRCGSKIKIIFQQPQLAVTPGQSAVIYHKDVLIGGGIIEEVIK